MVGIRAVAMLFVGDAGEHVREPSTEIDVVEFGGDNQRIHGRCPLATLIGTIEQP
jgi:hypothetical protein